MSDDYLDDVINEERIIGLHDPLRLDVAARLGFPDGSIKVSALRRLCVSKKLDHELIASKYFVTLAGIEEMRKRCATGQPHDSPLVWHSDSLPRL
jgi:hypothetical protein